MLHSCFLFNAYLASSAVTTESSAFGIVTLASLFPVLSVQILAGLLSLFRSASDVKARISTNSHWWDHSPVKELVLSLRAVVPLAAALLLIARITVANRPSAPYEASTELQLIDSHSSDIPGESQENLNSSIASPVNWIQIWIGIFAAQCGMILFNLGLRYGLEPLAQQVGSLLPGAYKSVTALPESPFYSQPVHKEAIAI